MGKTVIIIGIGGFLGSVSRYLMQLYFSRHWPVAFPLGTLMVNITGCLIIGVIYAISAKNSWLSLDMRLFLTTGICGGFTTFSTYSYEVILLLREGHYTTGIIYSVGSLCLGLLAVLAGIYLINLIIKL